MRAASSAGFSPGGAFLSPCGSDSTNADISSLVRSRYAAISASVATHASSSAAIAAWSMSCPMTTSSVRLSSGAPPSAAAAHVAPKATVKLPPARDAIPCCQWLRRFASHTRP
jgi:hypothetical protein